MPIYEYTCLDCQRLFETRRSIAEMDNEITCPYCGQAHTRRVVSRFAAFSSEGGQRRAVAGSSPCSGCSPTPGGCAGCGVRH